MISIAFYNLKGGVGKTTTAVNMAYLAAEAKKNTVLWDWDPQGAASWYLGGQHAPKKAIKVLSKGQPLGEFEVSTPYPRLNLIPADLSLRNADAILSEQEHARKWMRKIIEPLSENAAILIFDCPPAISPAVEYVLTAVDVVLVPMIPSPLSLRAADQVLEFFEGKKKAPRQIMGFFNMVDSRRRIHNETLALAKKMPMPMLKTFVPMDSQAEAMGLNKAPLVSYARRGRAAHAYRAMWRELLRQINKRRQEK